MSATLVLGATLVVDATLVLDAILVLGAIPSPEQVLYWGMYFHGC